MVSLETRKRMSEAYYKHIHPRCRPIGSEGVKKGYVRVKIAQPNEWKYKHVLVWEKLNGKLPDGHIVIFADRNKRNFDADNLIAITRKELVVMNRKRMIQDNPEATKAGKLIARLSIKIRDRTIRGGQ